MILTTNDIQQINSDPEARKRYDEEVDKRTFRPKEVDVHDVSCCTNEQMAAHFNSLMEDCVKGKVSITGTLVITNERKKEVRVANFIGRKQTQGPYWNESRVKFDSSEEMHRFRIAAEENTGLEFSTIYPETGDAPPEVQIFNGFRNYTNLAAHLIPQQKTATQRKQDREIQKFEREQSVEQLSDEEKSETD